MTPTRVLVTLLLTAALATSQSTARIEGRVIDQSNQPVRKATVRLQTVITAATRPTPNPVPNQPNPSYVEISDGDGRFAFDSLPAGTFILNAERFGYTVNNTSAPNAQITLKAGEVNRDAFIKMIALASIIGHVFDQDGDPVGGAQVRLVRSQYQNGRKQMQNAGAATSDEQGNFRIGNVAQGRYYIVAEDLRARSIRRSLNERLGRSAQEVNVTTYYPNGPDLQSAVPITLTSGAELRGADIRMRRSRVYSVRGKVTPVPPEGQIPNLWIAPKTDSPVNPADRMNDSMRLPDGTFEFSNLLPGTYVIQVTPGNSYRGPNGEAIQMNLTGRLEVSIGSADLDGVALSLSPAAEITGTISMDDGSPLKLPSLQVLTPISGPPGTVINRSRISLNDFDGLGNSPNGQVNEDGSFHISNVGPSRYLVNVASMPGTYIKSIRFSGQDITNAPLDATSNSGGILNIVLSRKAAEASLSLQDAKSGLRITMWSKTQRLHDQGTAIRNFTSSSGSIRVNNLAPGDYFVAAWEEIDNSLTQNPEFLAKMESEATHLTLAEGAKESVEVKIVPREKILAEAAKLP